MISGIGSGMNPSQMMQQMRSNAPQFSDIDANADGGISKSEFQSMLDSKGAPSIMQGKSDDLFNRMDANQDGLVDQSEHESALNKFESMVSEMAGFLGRDASMRGGSFGMGQSSENDPTETLLDLLAENDEEDES